MRVVRFALVGKTLRDVLVRNGWRRCGNGWLRRFRRQHRIGRGFFFLGRHRRLRNPKALHLFKRGNEKRGMMRAARVLKHLVHAGVRIVPRNNAPAVFDDARFFVGNFFARRA